MQISPVTNVFKLTREFIVEFLAFLIPDTKACRYQVCFLRRCFYSFLWFVFTLRMGLQLNTKYLLQEKIFQHRAASERMRFTPTPTHQPFFTFEWPSSNKLGINVNTCWNDMFLKNIQGNGCSFREFLRYKAYQH